MQRQPKGVQFWAVESFLLERRRLKQIMQKKHTVHLYKLPMADSEWEASKLKTCTVQRKQTVSFSCLFIVEKTGL